MTGKDSLIEEMAKIIRPVLTDRIHIAFIPALDKPIAQELYEQNYRKINENEVVISKEEYENLKNQVKELEKQRDEQSYITEDLIQEKHRWTEQARKETVRQFAESLKEKVKNFCGTEYENAYYDVTKSFACNDIDETLKEFLGETK